MQLMRRVEEEENHLVLLFSYFNLRTEDDSWDAELRALLSPKIPVLFDFSNTRERERHGERLSSPSATVAFNLFE